MNEIIQAYDEISRDYEDYSSKKSKYLSAIEELIVSELKNVDSIIDIGTGDGRRFKKILKKLGKTEHLAVEPSSKMVEICRERKIPVIQGSFSDLNEKIDMQFSAALALWNVLGHVETQALRIDALRQVYDLLPIDGIFICDINNRHNMMAYGYLTVFGRILLDRIFFDETRGDASYTWEINGKRFASRGHLFTPEEAEQTFIKSGFSVEQRWTVNYKSGKIKNNKYLGQLVYKLRKV